MRPFPFAALVLVFLCGEDAAAQSNDGELPKRLPVADEKLRQELLDRMEKDQVIRKEVMKQ